MRENSPIRAIFLFLFVLVLVVGVVLVVYSLQSSTTTPIASSPIASTPVFVAGEICTNPYIDNFNRIELGPNYSVYSASLQASLGLNAGKLHLSSNATDQYGGNYIILDGPEYSGNIQIEATISDYTPTTVDNSETYAGLALSQPTLFSSGVSWLKKPGQPDKVRFRINSLGNDQPVYEQTVDLGLNATTMTVKVSRNGVTFKAYYDIGNGYQLIGSHDLANYPEWMQSFYLNISAGYPQGSAANNKLSVRYDDVKIGCIIDETPNAESKYPVYRFWSDRLQKHFYTITEAEKNTLESDPKKVWKYERIAFYAYPVNADVYCPAGHNPVYRFWSDQKQGHFYTISEAEKQSVIDDYDDFVWKYERIAYCASTGSTGGSVPLYRFWSDTKQAHFYTNSDAEKQAVIDGYDDRVWLYESIAYYVYNSAL